MYYLLLKEKNKSTSKSLTESNRNSSDQTNVSLFTKPIETDTKFINFLPTNGILLSKGLNINGLSASVSQNVSSQKTVQMSENVGQEESDEPRKKAIKRRIFMKIGLNKQQKIRNSLHKTFLETNLNRN